MAPLNPTRLFYDPVILEIHDVFALIRVKTKEDFNKE
jgi:hypothetical protein